MLLDIYGVLLAFLTIKVSSIGVPQPNYLKMEFDVLRGSSRSSASIGAQPALVKRDGLSELVLVNAQTNYVSTLKLGTTGAENIVLVDTGSSDLWVVSSVVTCQASQKRSFEKFPGISRRRISDVGTDTGNSLEKRIDSVARDAPLRSLAAVMAASASTGLSCTASGTFDTESSSSFRVNASAPPFSISYGDGTSANGFWGTDTVTFGSVNVSDCSFGVVNVTSSDIGVFGIGLVGSESTFGGNLSSSSYTYQNFPLRLKNTGVIRKTLYSLYLNSANAISGSLLFGAVDHAKYSGTLQTVPIVNIFPANFSKPVSFDIVLDSITLESSLQNVTISTSHIAATLDSGTTLTYLPNSILTRLLSLMGGRLSTDGFYEVSCNYNTSSEFAVFDFSGARIKVPMTDLILTMESRCFLGLLGNDDTGPPNALLGDNFLRSAYVVYDLDDYEISLAQAEYTSSENIEVVSSSIPLAIRAPKYAATSVVPSASAAPPTSFRPSNARSQGSKQFYYMKSLLLAAVSACLFIFV